MGLRGSGPTKTLWPPLCAYLWVTHGKTKLVNVPGQLPWPLSGATGLSCSHGGGHCCMLTVHSHFHGIIHSLWIFETMKNTIYCLLPFVERQEGHIVVVRERSRLCFSPPAPHSQVPRGDLSYSREPRIRELELTSVRKRLQSSDWHTEASSKRSQTT